MVGSPIEEEGIMKGLLARRSGRVMGSTGAALAITAGIAYAAIPDSGGTIYACSLNHVGTIRLIDPAKSGLQGRCSSLETQVSWNQKGQPGAAGAKGDPGPKGDTGATGAAGDKGDKGDTGAAGAAGAAGAKGDKGDPGAAGAKGDTGATGATGAAGANGASGYQIVTAATGIPGGIEIIGTLACPAGKRATGGGWTTTDNDYRVNVIGSGPTADGGAWTGGMYNTGTLTAQVTLTAICITVPGSSPQALARTAEGPVFTEVKAD
jgi:hypothetical protein